MEVRHKITGKTQTMSADDWNVLTESGHSKNFEVTSAEEFTPAELTIPDQKSGPKSGGKSDGKDESKDK